MVSLSMQQMIWLQKQSHLILHKHQQQPLQALSLARFEMLLKTLELVVLLQMCSLLALHAVLAHV